MWLSLGLGLRGQMSGCVRAWVFGMGFVMGSGSGWAQFGFWLVFGLGLWLGLGLGLAFGLGLGLRLGRDSGAGFCWGYWL